MGFIKQKIINMKVQDASTQTVETKNQVAKNTFQTISEHIQKDSPRDAEYWQKYCGVTAKTYIDSIDEYDRQEIKKEQKRLIAGGFEEEYATLLSTAGYDTKKHHFNKTYKFLINVVIPEKKGLINHRSKLGSENLNEYCEYKTEIEENLLSLTLSLRDTDNNFCPVNERIIKEDIYKEYKNRDINFNIFDRTIGIINSLKDDKGRVDVKSLCKTYNVNSYNELEKIFHKIFLLSKFPEEKRLEIMETTDKYIEKYGDAIRYYDFYEIAFNKDGNFIEEKKELIQEFLNNNRCILRETMNFVEEYPALKEFLLNDIEIYCSSLKEELVPLLDKDGQLPKDIKEKAKQYIALTKPKNPKNFKELYLYCQDKNNPDLFDEELFNQTMNIITRPDYRNKFRRENVTQIIELIKNETNLTSIPFKKKIEFQGFFRKLISLDEQKFEYLKPITERIENDIKGQDFALPITKENKINFINNILKANETKEANSDFETTIIDAIPTLKENANGLPLEYSRAELLKDLQKICKDNPEAEQIIENKLEINLLKDKNNNFKGYNNIIILKNLDKNNPTEAKIYDCCNKFLYENEIKTDNEKLNKQLNYIIKAFPEFINVIGKEQHKTHNYSVDIHSLLVLAESINNPDYKKLNNEEKILIKLATLFHDITKDEGVVDKSHQFSGAIIAKRIINKIITNPNSADRIYDIIINHHFLENLSDTTNKEKTEKKIAFIFRRPKDFEIAKIIAEADLKAVNDDFYEVHKDALSNKNLKGVEEKINEINNTGNFIITTPIINKDKAMKKTLINGKEYPIINLNKIKNNEDMSNYGFEKGLSKSDLRFLVHMTDDFDKLILLTNNTNNGFLSESIVTPDYQRTYRKKKYGVFLSQKNYNLINTANINQGSGCAKDIDHCIDFIFNDFHRTNCRNNFFKTLGIKNNEKNIKEYGEFFKENISKLRTLSGITDDKEYTLCGKTIDGKKLKKAITATQNALIDKREEEHNEIIGYLPKIEGLIAKVDNEKDIPQEILDLSEKYNYPIIMI